MGNLGKSGGSSLWLLKKHQSGFLDGSSLASPLWEARMVTSEGHRITLQNLNLSLKGYRSSMDSASFKELRSETGIQKSWHELHPIVSNIKVAEELKPTELGHGFEMINPGTLESW